MDLDLDGDIYLISEATERAESESPEESRDSSARSLDRTNATGLGGLRERKRRGDAFSCVPSWRAEVIGCSATLWADVHLDDEHKVEASSPCQSPEACARPPITVTAPRTNK